MSFQSRIVLCIASLSLLACGDDPDSKEKEKVSKPDAAVVKDAAQQTDAGQPPDAGDPPAPQDDAGPPDESSGKACDPASRLGGFRVANEETYTTVDGNVQSKVVTSIKSALVGNEAGCELVKRSYPFCDPACESGQVCTVDGTCVSEPKSLNLGTVSITGLAAPVSMEPVQPGNRYFDTSLPMVGFDAGAKVRLRTSKADLAALDMNAVGVVPLELLDSTFVVERDKPLLVRWKKASEGKGEIRVTVNVDQHGSSPVTLECVAADVGSHEIPAKLVSALLDAGVTGFPTGHVFRESYDSTEVKKGCVDFAVASHRLAKISVVGHTPCMRPADCKAPQICEIAINTCVDP